MTHINPSTDSDEDEQRDQALEIVGFGPDGVEGYVTPWISHKSKGGSR